MSAYKQKESWFYDFSLPGHGRIRKGGWRTKTEALMAEKRVREALISGHSVVTFAEIYRDYLSATRMQARSLDSVEYLWRYIEPELGHLFVEQVTTSAIDAFKATLPQRLGPKSVNQYLAVISAALRFAWKREKLKHVPYIPKESVPRRIPEWYSERERDQLLEGMFRLQPQWYLFFYLSLRLGLRRGEVYALSHRQIREDVMQMVIDQSVQGGTKTRRSVLKSRKNGDSYTLYVTPDVLDAIHWHVEQGYSGDEFLFSKDGQWSTYLDSHERPLLAVQEKLNLRVLSHHEAGRHSVASQAATRGESMKAIQAQLGHKSEQSTHIYAHLGSKAQLHVLETLQPIRAPHVTGKNAVD